MTKNSNDHALMSTIKALGAGIAIIVFAYLSLLVNANPSKELIFAIIFESIFIAGILFFRFFASKRRASKVKNIVIEECLFQFPILKVLRSIVLKVSLTILAICFMVLVVDLSALIAARFGFFDYSRFVYINLPTYKIYDGAHPAFSLEVLSGATIEAGKYKQAHIYTSELLKIREAVFGKHHWMYGGMVANLAGIYYREKRYKTAEQAYRQSIEICIEDRGYKRLGCALTRLGNCLREQSRYKEAKKYYEEALTMRKNEFGDKSLRVAETIRELALLMTYLHEKKESDILFSEVNSILKKQASKPNSSFWTMITFVALSVLISISLFGKKGILTKMAIRKLERKIEQRGSDASSEDLERLNYLTEQSNR